jgi:hypothetical protein
MACSSLSNDQLIYMVREVKKHSSWARLMYHNYEITNFEVLL